MKGDLQRAIAQLSLDERFRLFMSAIAELREGALADAIASDQVGDARRTSANLGEIRAYRDIEALYLEGLRNRSDAEDPQN